MKKNWEQNPIEIMISLMPLNIIQKYFFNLTTIFCLGTFRNAATYKRQQDSRRRDDDENGERNRDSMQFKLGSMLY